MASGHRAQWKDFLKFGKVTCGVGLYTAASTSERITFNTINKASGNRVNRVFVESETEEPVPDGAADKRLRDREWAVDHHRPGRGRGHDPRK